MADVSASKYRLRVDDGLVLTSVSLYVSGGALDSQTTDSQFDNYEAYHQPHDAVAVRAGAAEVPSDDAHVVGHNQELVRVRLELARTRVELARTRIELTRTRRELYEYVGRWIMAGTHVERLADEVPGKVPCMQLLPDAYHVDL